MAEVKSKIPGSCHSGFYNPMTSKIARTFSNTRLWGLKFRSTCGRSFYSPNTLDFHLQRKHKSSNIVELFCSLCYVSFPKRSGLKKHNDILHRAHKNNIHTSEKEIAAFNAKIEMSPQAHKCKLCRKKIPYWKTSGAITIRFSTNFHTGHTLKTRRYHTFHFCMFWQIRSELWWVITTTAPTHQILTGQCRNQSFLIFKLINSSNSNSEKRDIAFQFITWDMSGTNVFKILAFTWAAFLQNKQCLSPSLNFVCFGDVRFPIFFLLNARVLSCDRAKPGNFDYWFVLN